MYNFLKRLTQPRNLISTVVLTSLLATASLRPSEALAAPCPNMKPNNTSLFELLMGFNNHEGDIGIRLRVPVVLNGKTFYGPHLVAFNFNNGLYVGGEPFGPHNCAPQPTPRPVR